MYWTVNRTKKQEKANKNLNTVREYKNQKKKEEEKDEKKISDKDRFMFTSAGLRIHQQPPQLRICTNIYPTHTHTHNTRTHALTTQTDEVRARKREQVRELERERERERVESVLFS